MAVMHPKDIENYDHTGSELKLFEALKEQLPEKVHVFFSVTWYDKVDGARVNSECDFLIFDPGFGFLTIECKGGLSISVEDNIWTLTEKDKKGNIGKRTLPKSPSAQAEGSMRYFYKSFSEEHGMTFNGVYGFAVAFPNYVIGRKVENAAAPELVIDFRHMSNLPHRLNEIFHYWQGKRNLKARISDDQKKKFLSLVDQKIVLSAAAGALIPIKEKEFKKINFAQDCIIDFLTNYRQAQIVGGAGTGKTFMAIKKMQRELHSGHKACYVCKSDELANFVATMLPRVETCTCKSFHHLMRDILKIPDDNKVGSFFDEVDKTDHERFDALIVDEAQDFSDDEALAIRLLLKDEKDSCLYVFMDKNQDLYGIDHENKFAMNSDPYILRYNIRNTGEIYQYAIDETGLGKETIANQLLGVEPDVKKYKTNMQALSTMAGIINRLVQKECVNTNSIVVLSDAPYAESVLSGETRIGAYPIVFSTKDRGDGDILFMTASEYKGLESDVVIYLKSRRDAEVDGPLRNKENYVALTRARYYLYIVERAK